MAKTAIFTIRLNVDDESDINPVHLCEEIQCYLNSLSYNEEEDAMDQINNEVTGYTYKFDNFIPYNYNNKNEITGFTFKFDNFIPFIPQEDY
jgi:hypothetical protein